MRGALSRLAALLVLTWAGGFLWFALALPEPAPAHIRTDAIVVLTGGPGRLARGITLLEAARAKRLLVSGVDPSVRPAELAVALHAPTPLFDCCIDLGREAADTRGNAEETAAWVRAHRYRSVRLVTSAYHMARAKLELEAQLGDGVVIVADPVPLELPADRLVREYSKYALRLVALRLGVA